MKHIILPDKLALGQRAAADGAALIREAITRQGHANIIVATGASQFEMIGCLVAERGIAWSRVTAFHLDEYVGLPIEHPASFRKYLWERFHRLLPQPLMAFHYLNGDAGPASAECERVGNILTRHVIDVAFVGIGENAHLAFNDPPADFQTQSPYHVVDLDEDCRRQQLGEGWFPELSAVPLQAISMSCQQILKSRAIVCSVPDQRKAKAVASSLRGPITPKIPASILQQHANTTLYLDPASASLL